MNYYMSYSFEDYFMDGEGMECIRKMEQQAERLTARLLMPATTVRKVIDACFKRFMPYNSFLQLEYTIKYLAEYYKVSIEMAKNRMVELGYAQARGVLNYVNNRYVPSHIIEEDVFRNKTYSISIKKLFAESERNKELEKLILSGQYIYIEGHLCKRDSKYIWQKNNKLIMSPYARNNMSKCCVLFTIRHNNNDYQYIPGTLNKAFQENSSDYLYTQEEYKDMFKQEDDYKKESPNVPESFYEAFMYYKHKFKLTYLDISVKTTIEKSKIERLTRKNEKERQPHTFEDAMAIAVNICPSPQLAIDFFEKSGHNMYKTVKDRFYRNLIFKLFGSDIEEYNFALKCVDLPLLVESDEMQLKECN